MLKKGESVNRYTFIPLNLFGNYYLSESVYKSACKKVSDTFIFKIILQILLHFLETCYNCMIILVYVKSSTLQ